MIADLYIAMIIFLDKQTGDEVMTYMYENSLRLQHIEQSRGHQICLAKGVRWEEQ